MHYTIPVIKNTWNNIQAENIIENVRGKSVLVLKGIMGLHQLNVIDLILLWHQNIWNIKNIYINF